MGVLADGKGIQCVRCRGTCTAKEKNCELCGATGRLKVEGKAWIKDIDGLADYTDIIRCVFASREHPMTIDQWLKAPALYVACHRFLIGHLLGELDARSKKIEDAKRKREEEKADAQE